MWTQRCRLRLYWILSALLLCTGGVLALTPSQQGNVLLIDGHATPLLFARNGPGTDARDLAAYRALGFNTLLVRIDSSGPAPLAAAEQLMSAAEQQGLYLLVELCNGHWSAEQSPDTRMAEYQTAAGRYLDNVIPRLAKHPNLVGWVISTVDEARFSCNILNFADYLRQKYGGEADVLDAWSVKDNDGNVIAAPLKFNFTLINQVSLANYISAFATIASPQGKEVPELIRADYTAYQALCAARDAAFHQYLARKYLSPAGVAAAWRCKYTWAVRGWQDLTQASILKHEHDRPGSSPASLLELASYQASFSPALMGWWSNALLQRDAQHLLFAGAQFSYRTLISLPHTLNGVLTECYPGVAEADIDTQNPQAIDIARRGNQFIVLAGILAQNIDADRLTNAIVTAAVHGAAGVCLTDWPALTDTTQGEATARVRDAVQSTFTAMRQLALWGLVPAAKTAIVYSPYLPGPPGGRTHGLYGYLTPSVLFPSARLPFFTFREGCGAGLVDYLAVGDLLNTTLLNRYAVVMLPSVFDLPVNADPRLDTQQALLTYARQAGHTVVADLGVGTMQANRDFYNLPVTMVQLLNIRNVSQHIGIEFTKENLTPDQPFTARFPTLHPGFRSMGIGSGGYVVTHSVPMLPLPHTSLIFDFTKGTGFNTPPAIHAPTILSLKPTRGVFIFHQSMDTQGPANGGYAIFFPFPLYQNWVPGLDPIFDEFHHDLLGLNADALLTCPNDFFPVLTEMGSYDDGSLIVWTKQLTRPALTRLTPERKLYLTTADGQGNLGPQATNFQFQTAGFHLLRPLPLTPADISAPPFSYSVTQYSARGVDLHILGCDDGQPRSLTLRLGSGAYPVAPGAQHLLTISTESTSQTVALTADADPAHPEQGILTLALPAGACRVQLTPVASAGDTQVVVNVHDMNSSNTPIGVHALPINPPDDTEPVINVHPAK